MSTRTEIVHRIFGISDMHGHIIHRYGDRYQHWLYRPISYQGDCDFIIHGNTVWRIRHFSGVANDFRDLCVSFLFDEVSGKFLWARFSGEGRFRAGRQVFSAKQLESGVRLWKEQRAEKRRLLARAVPCAYLIPIIWKYVK